MSFKKNKYQVIRQAVPKDLANFVMNYFFFVFTTRCSSLYVAK
jgi:hypothetical protein